MAAYIHRTGFNAIIVVVYRPGSKAITQSFFDDMNELLVRTSSYSTPIVIVGDLNVHVDDATDASSTKLADVLAAHSLVQHVDVPTHSLGHTLTSSSRVPIPP